MNPFIVSYSALNWSDVLAVSGSSYLLIFAAEIGDKSQLVCMILAAKYRALPVMFGSVLAFMLLNTLAVTFGLAIASWVPEALMTAIVAILFAIFGIHALRVEDEPDDDNVEIKKGHSIVITTFLLITVAEFGDKTQLAVVALSSTSIPVAVWIGSTVALITTSALGIWAGRTVLQRIPITFIHRISGVIFILLSLFAAYNAYMALQ
ncbi:MAG: TMEM165/GDT1 family protein [gamma proteobacterium symbiont of Lucinoma myriamae]|nr:TMEM165/GDT1 family protein [gamma proteobacterium symbiont of Lucinoma myriamae]MCU7818655.1 TMEM165/GDT1 family protein [gamma proteobacterium symbiont of Lucinoma myriamae]MCU7832676.1 TMEM165/GDT1 family protein [gamma proteobacterium symbiont of Lucinoma myriamae]